MRCDGSPDPSHAGEINTFLTLWNEDTDNNDISTSLNQIGLALKLIDETRHLIEDIEEKDSPLVDQYKQVRTQSDNRTSTWIADPKRLSLPDQDNQELGEGCVAQAEYDSSPSVAWRLRER